MRTWTVLAVGGGFVHSGRPASFELYGIVQAANPNDAFTKAVELASKHWPELDPTGSSAGSKMIDIEEINEIVPDQGTEVDVVDVSWAYE